MMGHSERKAGVRAWHMGLALSLAAGAAGAKVVKTTGGACQDALALLKAGDALVIDKPCTGDFTDPPSGIQVIGGSGTWHINQDVSDLVFFNHPAKILQNGTSRLRRVTSNSGCLGSVFHHIDSCSFICGHMSRDGVNIEVDGFMRSCSFLFDGSFMGSSAINFMSPKKTLGETWTKHASCLLINATDPVGDGSGSYVANIISHGQVDWTPVHIINGRGITVAHIGSEYVEWADPFITIENGVECAIVANNPGGHLGSDWSSNSLRLDDGTIGYANIGNRLGAWRIGGMNNTAIGGADYVGIRTGVTGMAWSSLLARDPYLTKWNPTQGSGVNFAKGLGLQNFETSDVSLLRAHENSSSMLVNSVAQCTTAFIDSNKAAHIAGLKPKSVRPGVGLHRPYVPAMPRLALDGDGPGTNMTGKDGAAILAAVNAGQTVYLGAGTYAIPGSLTGGGQVWGAGMDQTILTFPPDTRCATDKIGLFNLTVKGGKSGYTQTTVAGFNHGLSAGDLRFQGQSLVGMNNGCVQNSSISYIEFVDEPKGIGTCMDGIPCGENGSGGGKLYDKFEIYGCAFKNCNVGTTLSAGTDGFMSYMGCTFQDIHNTAIGDGARGVYIAGCDFKNVDSLAINCSYYFTVTNCTFSGKGKGITGPVGEVISCTFQGMPTAIDVGADYAFISDDSADGAIRTNASTWVGLSKFSNLDVRAGAQYGNTPLTPYVTTDPVLIDQTPPTPPGNLQVKAAGAHNYLTWTPSDDPESGVMQYIIERKGQEVGRTNFNYSANFHVLDLNGMWGQEGWPGPGVYHTPHPVYLDSNAAAQGFAAADYKVVAVNFAQIRSDSAMAKLRMFPNSLFPMLTTELDDFTQKYVKTSDTVHVPLGDLVLSPASGGKSYTAARYAPLSRSGEPDTGIVSIRRGHPSMAPAWPAKTALAVYDLRGHRLGWVRTGEAWDEGRLRQGLRDLRLPGGLYVLPDLRRKVLVPASGQ